MTTAVGGSRRKVPAFDVYDRMAKAMREAGIKRDSEMAERLSEKLAFPISGAMVNNYLNAVTPPAKHVLQAFAAATDVDENWLIGDYVKPPRKPRGKKLPHQDSDLEPFGYRPLGYRLGALQRVA